MSWILIAIAIIVAAVEWFTDKPKPTEPKWPRWIKLICAFIVASIGGWGLLEGYFAIYKGIDAYYDRELVSSIEFLNKAYSSPFKNRKVLDYLGLAHKNIADQSVDGPVAKSEYEISLKYFIESRVLYPKSPFAKNGMLNVYRRLKNWDELLPLAKSFESQLKSKTLDIDGSPIPDTLLATFLVTLGNIFADQDNPERSDQHAVNLYRLAFQRDPNNMFVILNMPPRLIDMAQAIPINSSERKKLLSESIELALKGLELKEESDQIFSVLAIIQVLLMDDAPPIIHEEYNLQKALDFFEKICNQTADFDIETWLVITDAYIKIGRIQKAKYSYNQALIYQARFTHEQHQWAKRIWKDLVNPGDYPFQQVFIENQ